MRLLSSQMKTRSQPTPHHTTDKRKDFTEVLGQTPFLENDDPLFWHGRLGCTLSSKESPMLHWESAQKPRDDHEAPDWLTASEFVDATSTMEKKVSLLAELLRVSKRTVVYTGAGISRAAGIGQAARGEGGTRNKTTTAQPTFTHHALTALFQEGLIHGWVQQNHDGLPQKAGFPQECINEVHGSWYDPSNPVVLYSGNLKTHECSWMERDARHADLALVLGTSLGGLNADQVATKPADRSLKGKSLGMVLINLQQTQHDGEASLRIFGKTNDALRALLTTLHIAPPRLPAVSEVLVKEPKERRVRVPYDANGKRSDTIQTWLDLRPGAAIRLNPNHNIQGAKQPIYMHIGARRPHRYKGERRPNRPGVGVVVRWNDRTVGIDLKIEGVHMLLAQWWLEAAKRGGPESLPIVNVDPHASGP